MTTKTVIISGEVTFLYDETSPIIAQTLKDFQEVIEKKGDIDSMLEHIAYNVCRFGLDSMVEGVGYVAIKGGKENEPFSGIYVQTGYDDMNFEID